MTKSKAMKCAEAFAKWVAKHELEDDLSIYVEGARYSVEPKTGKLIFDIEANPKRYLRYAGDFMSVSTEGPLYNIINFYNEFFPGYDEKMNDELNELFAKFNMYMEIGESWNFSLYEI